jgi:hypothetical protein
MRSSSSRRTEKQIQAYLSFLESVSDIHSTAGLLFGACQSRGDLENRKLAKGQLARLEGLVKQARTFMNHMESE